MSKAVSSVMPLEHFVWEGDSAASSFSHSEHSDEDRPFDLPFVENPEGPSTQRLRFRAPKAMPQMVFGTKGLKTLGQVLIVQFSDLLVWFGGRRTRRHQSSLGRLNSGRSGRKGIL